MKLLKNPKYFFWLWIVALIIVPYGCARLSIYPFTRPIPVSETKLDRFDILAFDKTGDLKILSVEECIDDANRHPAEYVLWKKDNRPNGPYTFRIAPDKVKLVKDTLNRRAEGQEGGFSIDVDNYRSGDQIIRLTDCGDKSDCEYTYRVKKDGTIQPLTFSVFNVFLLLQAIFVWFVAIIIVATVGDAWHKRLKAQYKLQEEGQKIGNTTKE